MSKPDSRRPMLKVVRPVLSAGTEFGDDQTRKSGPPDKKFHPYEFAEVQPVLAGQIAGIRRQIASLPSEYRGERVVIEAKLRPNYLAASYQPNLLKNTANLVPVGTRASKGLKRYQRKPDEPNTPTKTLLLAATDDSLLRLADLLAEPEPTDEISNEFIRFEHFTLPGANRMHMPRGEQDPEEWIAWEAVLHPAIDRQGRQSDLQLDRITSQLEDLLRRFDGELRRDYLRHVGPLTFVPIKLQRGHIDELQRFNPLRVVRPMPSIRRLPDKRTRGVQGGSTSSDPPASLPPDDHRMAVFDGGVDASHSLLSPFVTEGDLTTADRDEDYVAHGTLVTSAALYGHLEVGRALAPPPAHVDHFRVLPASPGVDPIDEPYWVLDQISNVLRGSPQRWKIVNLSLGPDNSTVDEDDDVNRFTAEIDQLADELGITFVVAAGNEGQREVSWLGEDRVMAPADGVNVIGVGACDDVPPAELRRAHYSCVGPGRPGLRVAPLGVAFGGSDGYEFVGADVGGGLQGNMGTSFSAPAVARGLATLLAVTDYSANLGRGLAAHFAESPPQQDLVQVGYGRLRDDYRPLLDCPPTTMTVVVNDEIERGTTRAYALPYPAGGVDGRVKLRWTISFQSPTDPLDAVEYTQAGLEVAMRPHALQYEMWKAGERPVTVNIGTDSETISRLDKDGWELRTNPKTRGGASKAIRSEQTLRADGKWETVMRHEDGALGKTLHRPAVWISYYQRLAGDLVPRADGTPLKFTLVMTVEADKVPDLYEQVRADARFASLLPLTPRVYVPGS